MNRSVRALLVAAILVMPTIARSEGALRGRLTTEYGVPIPATDIQLLGPQGGIFRQTDARGYFNIYGLTPGAYQFILLKDGFSPFIAHLKIREGMTRRFNVRACHCDAVAMWLPTEFIDPYSTSPVTSLSRDEFTSFATGRSLADLVEAIQP